MVSASSPIFVSLGSDPSLRFDRVACAGARARPPPGRGAALQVFRRELSDRHRNRTGVGHVVYAMSEAHLLELTGDHAENPTLSLPCRDVFAQGPALFEVIGPALEDEAAAVREDF